MSEPQNKYGAYLIVPFKYDEDTLNLSLLEELCPRAMVETMDLTENIKAMYNTAGDMAVGSVHPVKRRLLVEALCGSDHYKGCSVRSEGRDYSFDILPSYLYVFHTRVAFLCVGLSFECMEALYAICNPGFAENDSVFFRHSPSGETAVFSMEDWLETFMAPFGMKKFFDGKASLILEAYAYILALVPQPYKTLEQLRHVTFNLHQMLPIDNVVEDDSEQDIRYVYAVKNNGTYRWGCCVASQTISYAVADAEADLEMEMKTQARDGLPLVLLSLYEKYTCLRFTQLISQDSRMRSRELKGLKSLMLKFKAFGTVTPANVSRWNNVREIFACMQQVNDVQTAVEDISSKITILTEHQQEIERSRNETVVNIITIFGIVSILASVMSIVQILADGDPLIWASTVLTSLVLAATFLIAALKFRK